MKKIVPSFEIEHCEECPYYIGSCKKCPGMKHSYCNYDDDFTIISSWEMIGRNFPNSCPLPNKL